MNIKNDIINDVFISVITPVYGCYATLEELCIRIDKTLSNIATNYEIILVNDASPDNAWEVIQSLAQKDERIKGINLSRNFGQHRAIAAGLDFAQGNWIVVMDCDLQDQPEEILKFYKKAQEGYDIVVGKRINRKDSLFIKLTSKIFYVVFNYLTAQKLDNSVANFGIYSRRVIDSILLLKEQDRSFGLLSVWVGFSRASIDIKHAPRKIGQSGYNLKKRILLAVDHILSHSNKPLIIAVNLGFILSFCSFIYALWLIIRYFLWSVSILGWSSLMVSLFFLAGLNISIIGMVGLYVGKIYEGIKNRPLYIIKEKTSNIKKLNKF
jgi:dolichol-phosphate mannosyltransferase